jgi:YVTN family beta-propeller protein
MRHFASILLLLCTTGCVSTHYPPGIEKTLKHRPQNFLEQAVVGPQGDGTYVVPTAQAVKPAGESVLFPGRPTGLAISPDEKTLAVKNSSDIVFIDMASRTITQILPLEKGGNSFCGIGWSSDGETLWTTSATGLWEQYYPNFLLGAHKDKSDRFRWTQKIELPGPEGTDYSAPGGFAIDRERGLIYVALSKNNTISVVDLALIKLVEQIPVGIAPYDVLICRDKAYVTNWAGRRPREGDITGPTSGSKAVTNQAGIVSTGTVSVINLNSRRTIAEIEVDLHPCGMVLSPDDSRLYIANANSDTVSVIDTATDRVIARWGTKPMEELPFGSAPNALDVSPDGSTLYVANGGNNCIAVIDTFTGRIIGLIPTGWYPGDVRLTHSGNLLCIANTKGVGSRNKVTQRQALSKYLGRELPEGNHNSHDHLGSVCFVPTPNTAKLEEYTIHTATNMNLPRMHQVMNLKTVEERKVPVPAQPGEISTFKHVLYIIKENRTYDQIFGDLPQGNGDPSLCHFGRDVTPNHHNLAEQFVLLDNFYCNGVLSADGHQWTDEGYVTDYIEKSFGGFTRSYPFDGNDALAYASSGFIWDHTLRAGLTFRNYGEMVKANIEPSNATWADIYNDYLNGTSKIKIRATAMVRGLENYTCPAFVGFPGVVQDVYRTEQFLREFRSCEAKGQWYNLIIMLLPNNHTSGTSEGYPTPRAMVTDNDLALGRIVEAVSHSRFWHETVIFVVEDDPQDGLDHVDGHRTVALCISPYTKRHQVDSTYYNQSSMLRTIELILGLSPMNQFNMAANPMLNCFTEMPDFTPYTALPNNVALDEMNPPVSSLRGKERYYALKSMELPLDEVDRADEDMLNRIIWHSVKGYDVPYPRQAFRPDGTAP